MSARDLPAGTVTFLFTDIEGSTRLVQALGDRYGAAHEAHNRILRDAFAAHDGVELRSEGDSFFYAFPRARDAVLAAVTAQQGLAAQDWPGDDPVRVRIGMHTGEADIVGGEYVGVDVWRAARISDAGNGGQILVSSTTKELAGDLPEGVGVRDLGRHRLKDLERDEQLWQITIDGLPTDARLPRTLTALPNNLPMQLTSFVGRDEELATVRGLLADSRLATLTGAGGSGKTRLAVEAGLSLLHAYPDGVWLVDLAPLSDPALVPQAFADAVGAGAARGSTDALEEVLGPRTLLLIVDNCEHLLDKTCDVIELILKRAPQVTVLATSREPLGLPGEAIMRVRSLSVPDPNDTPDEILRSDAAALFVERARLARHDFSVTAETATAIAEICRRLDGIPLAIELAAARVKSLTPAMIADRLDDAFRLLAGSGRGSLERQQTLRALVDWSHRLLDEREQILFRRLSVFAGGFTLDAAEAVCADEQVDPYDVMDLVGQLVDRSMVIADDAADGIRYRMLETLRQYGREKLLEAGEADIFRERHRDWFTALAAPLLDDQTPSAKALHERIAMELDNVRAALEFSLDRLSPGDIEPAGSLAAALVPFWHAALRAGEGYRWVERVLDVDDLSAQIRARLLLGVYILAPPELPAEPLQAMLTEAERLADEAGDERLVVSIMFYRATMRVSDTDRDDLVDAVIDRGREAGNRAMVARALVLLAMRAFNEGETDEGQRIAAEAVEEARRANDAEALAFAVSQRGRLAWLAQDQATSLEAIDEWITLAEQVPGTKSLIAAEFRAGYVHWRNLDRALARRHWTRHLELLEQAAEVPPGSRRHHAIAAIEDDRAYARASLERSADLLERTGDFASVMMAFEGLGLLAMEERDFAAFASIIGAYRERVREANAALDIYTACQQAIGHAFAGDHAEARAILGSVSGRFETELPPATRVVCLWFAAIASLATGDPREAARYCEAAMTIPLTATEPWFRLHVLRPVLQELGEHEAAAIAHGAVEANPQGSDVLSEAVIEHLQTAFPAPDGHPDAIARGRGMPMKEAVEIARGALTNHATAQQVEGQPQQQQ